MKSNTSKLFAWIIVFLLVIGLAGFGIQDIISGSGRSNIAIVGKKKIKPEHLVKAIQQEIVILSNKLNTNLSFQEADQLGVSKLAFQKILLNSILNEKSRELRISISDENLIKAIKNDNIFKNLNGEFDVSKYENLLKNANYKKSEYEELIREEKSREILLSVLNFETKIPQSIIEIIKTFSLEKRKIKLYNLNENLQLAPPPFPNDNILKSIYEKKESEFIKPATKKIEYIILKPEFLFKKSDIKKDIVKSIYDQNIKQYTKNEKKSVERLVFKSMEIANEKKSKLDKNDITFDDIINEKKLKLSDVSLGDVEFNDLETKVAKKLFSEEKVGIFGPFDTELGPAIFRVKKIIPKKVIPLEDVYDEISKNIAMTKASKKIEDIYKKVTDEIAAGVLYDEIIKKYPFEINNIEYNVNMKNNKIFTEEKFIEIVNNENSYPSNLEYTTDGSIFSLRVSNTEEERLKTFQEVKDELYKIYLKNENDKELLKKAKNLKNMYENDKETKNLFFQNQNNIKDFELSRYEENKYITEENNDKIFSISSPEDLVVIKNENSISLVKIEKIITDNFPNEYDQQINNFYSESINQDIADSLINSFRKNLDIRIYQKNIDDTILLFQ